MDVRHRALVGAKNPPLQETGDSMHSWHGHVSRVTGGRYDRLLVRVPALRQSAVTGPAVGADRRARGHHVRNERSQAEIRSVRDVAHAHPSEAFGLLHLDRDSDKALVGAAAGLAAVLNTTNQSLVYLNITGQWLAFRTHHGHSKPLQHRPGYSVSRTQRALKRFRRQTVLRGRNVPRCLKPCRQRRARLVENRSGGDRGLVPTTRTYQATPSLPPRICRNSACRTPESAWPAQPLQVGGASRIIRKPVNELAVRTRIVAASDRPGRQWSTNIRRLHPYILCQEELTVHPFFRISKCKWLLGPMLAIRSPSLTR